MRKRKPHVVVGVSGGPDSVYLLHGLLGGPTLPIVAHVNHGARGEDSDADQRFVERLAETLRLPVECLHTRSPVSGAGFEHAARETRYAFFRRVMGEYGCGKTLVAHTADDQVETILMRVLEGAGISGLKGMPKKTSNGVERPILDIWRDDIMKYLKENKIFFREDDSNLDIRFERNWIRHVLIPLLEKRYGKAVKKRIFALGERFREIDRFLEDMARKWIGRNLRSEPAVFRFRRKPFGKLPLELRIRILQILSREKARIDPNERLLASMDRLVLSGGPSARVAVGKGATLSLSYEDARLALGEGEEGKRSWKPVRMTGSGTYGIPGAEIRWEEKIGGMAGPAIRKRSAGERTALFDAGGIRTPLTIRPLAHGDRIRPFGTGAETKVKEILIDRKVPRDVRWGRPAVCDANGSILWIPGVVRSAHLPVTPATRRTIRLGISGRKT